MYKEAIESYKQSIRIDPDLAGVHTNLGVAYGSLGMYKEAIESFQQSIRINPDYAEVHTNLGVTYGKSGMYKEAFEAYKQAIRINPDDALAHFNLGITYAIFLNDRDSALEQYKILKSLDPEKANELYNMIYK
jgi:tetratricopeptide (TPR) repeat protein